MRRTKPSTLTRRIAALLLCAAAVVFALTSVALDQVLGRELSQRDAVELVGKVEQLRHLLQEGTTNRSIQADPHAFEDVVIGHEGLGFQILSANRMVILKAGADLNAVAEKAAAPVRAVGKEGMPSPDDVRLVRHGDQQWRVLAARVQPAGGETFEIVVGRDLESTVALRDAYRSAMLLGSLVAAFGTAIIGWLAVWRGIRPLAAMAAAAHRITVNRLAERVQVPESAPAEVRELADAFNGMIDRLQEAFYRLSLFSADLAHDMRTPLANLLLQTQVVLSRARTVDEYQGLLAANIEQFERLQRMVDEMLFLARADNAQIALRLEEVDVRPELDRVAEYFQPAADDRRIRITVSGESAVRADVTLLQRAVGNLLSNAIRHATPNSQIQLRTTTCGTSVCIEVSNEGVGIAGEDLPYVFDRFWRGDRARSASGSSSGLGLAIVRSIVQLHGGDAAVESAPAGTTTFRLRLPRA